MHEHLTVLSPEDRVGRAGGGDHDVRLIGSAVELIKMDRRASHPLCHLERALMRAIRDEDRAGSVRTQMTCS